MADETMPQSSAGYKKCKNCGKVKRLDEFYFEPRVRDKRTARCLICLRAKEAAWREEHPDRIRIAREKYAAKFPERIQEAKNFSQRRAMLERREARIAAGKPVLEPRVTDDGRWCGSCRRRKPKDEFYTAISIPDGYSRTCKECQRRKSRQHAKKPPVQEYRRQYMRRRSLLLRYGLTVEQFDTLVAAQDQKCKICLDELRFGWGGMAVDHCHATGKVRGILCSICNRGLGHFKDNPNFLRRAAAYLEEEE